MLSISIAESVVGIRYAEIESPAILNEIVYAHEVEGRLATLTKDRYLERVPRYKDAVISNRLIILSASFEVYLNNFFVEAYFAARPKFYDQATRKRTVAGDELYGEVMKVRGLSARIAKMAEEVPFKIKSIKVSLEYVDDAYMLRNVLAHRAGQVDDYAAQSIKHISSRLGDRVVMTAQQMMALAAPVIKVAEALDRKLAQT